MKFSLSPANQQLLRFGFEFSRIRNCTTFFDQSRCHPTPLLAKYCHPSLAPPNGLPKHQSSQPHRVSPPPPYHQTNRYSPQIRSRVYLPLCTLCCPPTRCSAVWRCDDSPVWPLAQSRAVRPFFFLALRGAPGHPQPRASHKHVRGVLYARFTAPWRRRRWVSDCERERHIDRGTASSVVSLPPPAPLFS